MYDQLGLRRHLKSLFANKLTTPWEKEKNTKDKQMNTKHNIEN